MIQPYALTPLELACGLVLGLGDPSPELGHNGDSPRAAFELSIRAALEQPPCLVSFSGGRDSSAVLAVATSVARRDGLPLPIPATNRVAGALAADETEWQELVIAHLGLTDWFRNEVRDELDCVGPVAGETLRRHGLLWPFNTFFHVPLLEAASGGSLVTGIGGDEVLGTSRWARTAAVLSGAVRPQPRDALRVGLALAPAPIRRRVLRRRLEIRFPWLHEEAERHVLAALAAENASEPLRWGTGYSWWRSLRHWQVAERSLALLAADARVRIVHPFAEQRFSAALAHLPRHLRFSCRTEAMSMLFGDLLPPVVLGRVSKASFDEAFFNVHSRGLAEDWEGEGVEPSLVDPHALRDHWLGQAPDARSFLLLQAAWLARAGSASTAADSSVAAGVRTKSSI